MQGPGRAPGTAAHPPTATTPVAAFGSDGHGGRSAPVTRTSSAMNARATGVSPVVAVATASDRETAGSHGTKRTPEIGVHGDTAVRGTSATARPSATSAAGWRNRRPCNGHRHGSPAGSAPGAPAEPFRAGRPSMSVRRARRAAPIRGPPASAARKAPSAPSRSAAARPGFPAEPWPRRPRLITSSSRRQARRAGIKSMISPSSIAGSKRDEPR